MKNTNFFAELKRRQIAQEVEQKERQGAAAIPAPNKPFFDDPNYKSIFVSHVASPGWKKARAARSCTRPGRSSSVLFGSSCQIHHSYVGVWG
jgi:hypothetical protein